MWLCLPGSLPWCKCWGRVVCAWSLVPPHTHLHELHQPCMSVRGSSPAPGPVFILASSHQLLGSSIYLSIFPVILYSVPPYSSCLILHISHLIVHSHIHETLWKNLQFYVPNFRIGPFLSIPLPKKISKLSSSLFS